MSGASGVLSRAAALLLVLASVAGLAAAERLVAIGDIHGDYDSLVSVLRAAELVGEDTSWTGGDTTLIQTGDFLDRGRRVRDVMDLLMRLQEEAPQQGGRVIALLGNHEAMNLFGVVRDVNPEVYADFVDEKSEDRLRKAWHSYVRAETRAARRQRRKPPAFSVEQEKEYARLNPPGSFEYREALGPKGKYGRWLRTLPVAVRQGDGVFLHGGLSPSFADWSVKQLNDAVDKELAGLDSCRLQLQRDRLIPDGADLTAVVVAANEALGPLLQQLESAPPPIARQVRQQVRALKPCADYKSWLLFREDGPVWFRGYSRWTPEEGTSQVADLLARLGAQYLVVGHTPQKSFTIQTRFDNRVFLIDTGMLQSVYRGRASALEVTGGQFNAVYADERVSLPAPNGPVPVTASSAMRLYRDSEGGWLPFENDDEVLAFLASAEPVERSRTEKGVNRPLKMLLEQNGLSAYAVFRAVHEVRPVYIDPEGRRHRNFVDSYRHEPAAYWVDRLFGIGRVPPAVLRVLDGREGSMQLWLHGVMDEEDRLADGIEPANPRDWVRQGNVRRLFDQLIDNVDRNKGNILIDRDTFRVWLIDHTRAFTVSEELADPAQVTQCERHVWRELREVRPELLRERLTEFLTPNQVEALVSRWRQVVAVLDRRISEQGEKAVLF